VLRAASTCCLKSGQCQRHCRMALRKQLYSPASLDSPATGLVACATCSACCRGKAEAGCGCWCCCDWQRRACPKSEAGSMSCWPTPIDCTMTGAATARCQTTPRQRWLSHLHTSRPCLRQLAL
jgi:hypothetical protein